MVVAIQSVVGYGCGGLVIDGDFGPRTRNAVICFQRRNHLNPDAIVGPHTWAAIGRYLVDFGPLDGWTYWAAFGSDTKFRDWTTTQRWYVLFHGKWVRLNLNYPGT